MFVCHMSQQQQEGTVQHFGAIRTCYKYGHFTFAFDLDCHEKVKLENTNTNFKTFDSGTGPCRSPSSFTSLPVIFVKPQCPNLTILVFHFFTFFVSDEQYDETTPEP